MIAWGGVEVMLYVFFNRGATCRWAVNSTPRPLFPHEGATVSIVQEAGWASGPVWTGAEYFALTGVRTPERPVVARRTDCAIVTPSLRFSDN